MSVVSIGAYLRDLMMYGARLPNPGETVDCHEYLEAHGGKGANQAVAAARMGATSAFVGRVGRDPAGQSAYEMLAREGVDPRGVVLDDTNTGCSFIIVEHGGLQLITNYLGASAKLSEHDLDVAASTIQSASVMLLQGEISPIISAAAAHMARPDAAVILNPAPAESFVGWDSFNQVNILIPNAHEAAVLVGTDGPTAEAAAVATGVSTVLVTRGGEGVEVFHDGRTIMLAATPVDVVDTTGAGDAFIGAFAAGLDRGLPVLIAAKHACHCASWSVGRRSCVPSFATETELPWPSRSGIVR